MPAEFTGEQKLRIVLESIIRGVPRDDQCKKYGITSEQFQTWHDHLIKNGGRIYEQTGSGSARLSTQGRKTRSRKVKYVPWYIKFLLILSIFSNLAAGIVWAVWYWSVNPHERSPIPSAGQLISQVDGLDGNTSELEGRSDRPIELDDLIEQVDQFGKLSDDGIENGLETPDLGKNSKANLEEMLAPALKLPEPPSSLELGNRVDFIDQTYEAKHVVYLIDVGSYQLKGPNAVERLESMKLSVLESLTKLSANSYFNLVLCWNLRESHALGKTILRANDENKRYATEWITSLGTSPELLKEGRNQFYPKELLYAQVLPGVVGPWYGLATAMSYDPDIVFFLAGNMPDFSPDEVSRNDFNGLGINLDTNLLANPQSAGVGQGLNSLIRKTAGYWLVALQSERNLPDNAEEIEEIALKRLGIDSSLPGLSLQKHSIPWEKAFDNFLAGLELGIAKIPQVHVFQTLQEHTRWPTSLQKSMAEFCESTRGNLSVFP
ncbi:hypothetical protein OAN13_02910 [Opitutales bacterium]|nr:hypothetical protein [Opitutales bacterium]